MMAITISGISQTVNADGSLKMRANVAVMVTGNCYTFNNRVFQKTVDDGTLETLKSSVYALVMQEFQNMCFGIVNRDDEAYSKVKSLIEENRLEDYLDGFSVQAKNQGADYLCLVDVSLYSEGNKTIQFFISMRVLDVSNNTGYHYSLKSDAMSINEDNLRQSAVNVVKLIPEFLRQKLMCIFPEQYFIAKADGKKLWLGAYQPNGLILETDSFYGFNYNKRSEKMNGVSLELQSLEKICDGKVSNENGGGYLVLKTNKKITPSNDIVFFKENAEPSMPPVMTITFFGFNSQSNTYDGFIMNRVNNAFYHAITSHPGLSLVEHDHLGDLKKERELQKTEDFIDGHVVEQIKAIGAQYLIHINDFDINGAQVSFKMSIISIAENRIMRTVDVVSSIDNIENEIYKQLCERIAAPCLLKSSHKNEIEFATPMGVHSGTQCILSATKAIENPINHEVSYQRTDLCVLVINEYKGNYLTANVKKVLSKEDFQMLDEYSQRGALTIRIDGSVIKSDYNINSLVEELSNKEGKKESIFNKVRNTVNKTVDKAKNVVDTYNKKSSRKSSLTVNGKTVYSTGNN